MAATFARTVTLFAIAYAVVALVLVASVRAGDLADRPPALGSPSPDGTPAVSAGH